MRKLSVVIITKNEERNIERCLESVCNIAEDIVVLDAFSTDKTEEVCFKYNVNFVQREWTNYSDARNYAASLAKYDLILALDADEVLSNELNKEIRKVKLREDNCAYQFNRITSLCGKWIEHSGWFPDWKTRLFDRRIAMWEGIVHEKLVIQKTVKVRKLKGLCYHFSFESFDVFLAKTENYAELSARSDFEKGKKALLYGYYMKPVLKFVTIYFFKRGFLDGAVGITIAKIAAHGIRHKYEILKNLYASKPKSA